MSAQSLDDRLDPVLPPALYSVGEGDSIVPRLTPLWQHRGAARKGNLGSSICAKR
jgi:hypothetical protein